MSKLIVAATPLGNFRDASERLREAIKESRFIVVEDSRKFSRLCSDLEIESEAKILTFFEGNEKERLIELERALIEFPEVLLLTDAGIRISRKLVAPLNALWSILLSLDFGSNSTCTRPVAARNALSSMLVTDSGI